MNSVTRIYPVVTAVVLLLLVPTTAMGDQQQVDDADQALQYYQDAGEAYQQGEYERAAELLERAWERDEQLVYRYNQILALEGAGHYDRALELLDDYQPKLADHDDFGDIDEIRSDLEEAIALRDAEEADDDTTDKIDPPDDVEPVDQPANVLAWSLTGGGAALFSTGLLLSTGVFIGDTIDRIETAADDGVQAVYDDTDYDPDDDLGTLRTHRWLAAGMLIGGAAIGATGAVMLYSTPDSDPDAHTQVTLRPMVDIFSAGAMLEARF